MPELSQRSYDLLHKESVSLLEKRIQNLYKRLIKDVAKETASLPLNKKGEFYFRNYPNINRKVNKLLETFYKDVYTDTVAGVHSAWDLAVEKNNKVAQWVFGDNIDKIPTAYKEKYLSNNAAARRAFVFQKTTDGLTLSDKIWKNTRQFKTEIELAVELNLSKGKSAASMAKDIKQYLNDPDKLFRRVRNENKELRLSKAAAAYKPGPGRYRSSYKNTLRLARNQINFAYEGSRKLKREQQDFVVGIEIRTSPSHRPEDDKKGIKCIELAGKYPKDFDWTYKWHVNCKCYSVAILKTRKELDMDLDKLLRNEKPDTVSKNQVSGKPINYLTYVKENPKFSTYTFSRNPL